MDPHPHFNLRLHDDEELAGLLGEPLRERIILHEWPLSCVQRLTTASGRRFVYKTAFGPTVEADFYTQARSALLLPARTLYRAEGYSCLLLDFVAGPRLEELTLSAAEALTIGQAVSEQIQMIEGELPYYLDLSGPDGWPGVVETMLTDLDALITAGSFSQTTATTRRSIERRAMSAAVSTVAAAEPGLVHHDLSGDNLFVLPGGFRVIDWQRPLRGPVGLDLVTLLESLGFEPAEYLPPPLVQLKDLLTIHWLARCARRWFPPGRPTYDRTIAELIARIDAVGEVGHRS